MNSIVRARIESLGGYRRDDISESKRYLGYFIDGYVRGRSSVTYCLLEDKIPSDKIKNVIVKYFRYMGVDFNCYYRKSTYWIITLSFGEL